MNNPFDDPVGTQIMGAFPHPTDCRTLAGIARASGLPIHEVHSYVKAHPDLFPVSPVRPSGMALYSLNPHMQSILSR